jgi:hypothetical protein
MKLAAPGRYPARMASDVRDELLGRLLGVPLDRFVEQRNRLARELREQGDRDTASWLASLRRPRPGVWALDQLARGDPSRIGALIDLGDELGDAQVRAMRGDREAAPEMRDLGGRLQRAVDDVVRRAVDVLRDAGHGASTDTMLSMSATLRNALGATAEARRQLAAGLLLAPVEESDGFGFGAAASQRPGLRVIEGGASRARVSAERHDDDHDVEQRREMRRLADEAVRAADQAEQEAARLQATAEEMRARVAEIGDRLRLLEAELTAAQDAAQEADADARDAVVRARAARREADAAEAGVPGD